MRALVLALAVSLVAAVAASAETDEAAAYSAGRSMDRLGPAAAEPAAVAGRYSNAAPALAQDARPAARAAKAEPPPAAPDLREPRTNAVGKVVLALGAVMIIGSGGLSAILGMGVAALGGALWVREDLPR